MSIEASMAISKYDDLIEKDKTLETTGLFDKVTASYAPIITKVFQDSLHSENEKLKGTATEIMDRYNEYQKNDRMYRIKGKKAKKIKKILEENHIDGEEKELFTKELNDLRKEITDYYIEPIDIYRLAVEFFEYESQDTRWRRKSEYEDAKKERTGQKKEELESIKGELKEKLEEIDKWSSNNIKTYASRIGTVGGTYFIADTVVESVKDVKIFGYSLDELKGMAMGIALVTLPLVDYVLSKKKSKTIKEYEEKEKKAARKSKDDIAEMRRELSKQFRDIYDLEHEKRKDTYEMCFGTLEGFPENPIDMDNKRRKKLKIESRTPLISVEAEDTEDIRRKAEQLRIEAEKRFG